MELPLHMLPLCCHFLIPGYFHHLVVLFGLGKLPKPKLGKSARDNFEQARFKSGWLGRLTPRRNVATPTTSCQDPLHAVLCCAVVRCYSRHV
jgi:hypothetical protein